MRTGAVAILLLAANFAALGESHLHQGRRDQMEFRSRSAQRHFAAALGERPDDAEALQFYASATNDPRLEIQLLERLAGLPLAPALYRQRALAHLEFHRNLGSRELNELLTPYVPVTWKMPVGYSPQGASLGWILRVRINGGRPLRMLVDTGSRNILIGKNQARGLGLEPLGTVPIGGFGEGSEQEAQATLAKRLRIGEVEWANVLVEVAPQSLDADVDGLLGLDVLRQFRVTFDGPAGTLSLAPYADARAADGAGEHPWADFDAPSPSLRRAGHLLFTPVPQGVHFVLDSGAGVSIVHREQQGEGFSKLVLAGLSGDVRASRLDSHRLAVAGSGIALRNAVAMDLSPMSQSLGLHIGGFLGFPVFRNAVTHINVRDGEWAIQPSGRLADNRR